MKIQVSHNQDGDFYFYLKKKTKHLCQETTSDQSNSLKDWMVQLAWVQGITGCLD